MTGPLLKSCSLTAFHPVGAVGNPVYLAASQLRAAIARRLGADVADTFAIPQRNEDGDTVDWYAPQPGPVVPWSAASATERTAAQQRLLTVRTQIEALGRRMEAEVSSERQVFGRLLAHVMSFPDDDDVHLVNGQPVLTFWGFVKDRAAVGSDPLRSLDMHIAQTEPPPRRMLPWWQWPLLGLLLLLLLLIALLALRGCEAPPKVADPTSPATSEETRQLTGAEPTKEQTTLAPEQPLASDTDLVRIDRNTPIGDRDPTLTDIVRVGAEGSASTLRDHTEADLAAGAVVDDIAREADAEETLGDAAGDAEVMADDEALAVDAELADGDGGFPLEPADEAVAAADVVAEDIAAADVAVDATAAEGRDDEAGDAEVMTDGEALAADAAGPNAPAEDAAADQAEADSETSASDAEAGADDAAADGADAVEPGAETDSGVDPAAETVDAARAEAGAAGSDLAVRIPPERLLNSGWRTSTTLLDPKDGSPIHLDYRLKDGSGKVRLQRQDGSLCESGASAKVRDGRLVVDSAGEIVCADGTSFGRPQIDCNPQVGGKARCVGRYPDGSTFPIDMQQQPD